MAERGRDLWFRFTLGRAGAVILLLESEPRWNTYLYLLRGGCEGLEVVTHNDDREWRRSSYIASGPLAPGTYHVVVTGADVGDAGPFTLQAAFHDIPGHDACDAAESILPAGERVLVGTTTGASADGPRGPDVWYRFELDAAASVELLVESEPRWNTYLTLLSGACDSPVVLQENDDLEWHRSSRVVSGPLGPGAYLVAVAGAGPLDFGAYGLTVRFSPVPDHDQCPDATSVEPVGHQEVAGTTIGASRHGDRGPTVWYRLDLPRPLSVRALMESDPAWDTWLAIYAGPCDALVPVVHNDNLAWRQSSYVVTGPLDPGLYHVAASGNRALDFGPYALALDFDTIPAGDRCEDGRPLIPDGVQTVEGATTGAGAEHAAGRGPDVWFPFFLEEPTAVAAQVRSDPAWNTWLALLSGNCDELVPRVENDNLEWHRSSAIVTEPLEVGWHQLVVSGNGLLDFGPYALSVQFISPPPNDRCESATPLELTEGRVAATGTTAGGSRQHNPQRGPDAWYRLDPVEAAAGTFVLRSEPTPWDTWLAVFTGSCDALEPLGHNDNQEWRRSSRLELGRIEPGPLHVVAAGNGHRDYGEFTLSIFLEPSNEP